MSFRQPPAGSGRKAWIVSAVLHAALIAGVAAWALLRPEPPPVTAVFELVAVEKPRLRPLAPKTPDPPAETPSPSRPPPAPAPKPAPRKPAPPKPEPQKPRPAPLDTSLPVREAPVQNQELNTTVVANVPSDPRLAFWAARVKKRVETLWNPPTGIDVVPGAKTIVSFQVSRDGEIAGVEVSQGSGNPFLDDLARRTILRLERVAPIPEHFPEDRLKVSYEFIYNGN